jgi:hypothetical protein
MSQVPPIDAASIDQGGRAQRAAAWEGLAIRRGKSFVPPRLLERRICLDRQSAGRLQRNRLVP